MIRVLTIRFGRAACFSLITLTAGISQTPARAEQRQATAGAESPDRGRQALAFLPNELWIHTNDSIRWAFPTHERHTVTFLKAGQTRPPAFGPTFGVLAGCPGITSDDSSFDGSACVTSDILLTDSDEGRTRSVPTYTVHFPSPGNFKLVCLVHPDMTGVVHVIDSPQSLPYTQAFYDRDAQSQQVATVAEVSHSEPRPHFGDRVRAERAEVAAGIGKILTTTGAGSQTASLMRFLEYTTVVRVGDTVEWTSLDPSINHTITFGTEPADPRPPSSDVQLTPDGARHAIISSPTENVNSGFLSPAPQDRPGLTQSPPGVTRFRVTFTSPGKFDYICAIHDDLGMKGTVLVY